MKLKYLSLLLSGLVILPVGAFASADSVDGFTSDSDICVYDISNVGFATNEISIAPRDCDSLDYNDECLYAYVDLPSDSLPVYVANGLSCNGDSDPQLVSSMPLSLRVQLLDSGISLYESYTSAQNNVKRLITSGKVYLSKSPISYSSSSGGGSDTPENPEIPLDVVGSFKTTLQGLVSDLVIGFYNYFPLVIVMGIGVLMIFTLRGYIRHASSEIFTLNKNSKKSLSWFQNEDIVNMYTNWKKDRVSKHDINNIVKDTVLPDDPGYYDKDGIRYYTDGDLYTRDLREYETKIYQQGYQELSKNSSDFNHMSSEDQMITLGKYKMQYMDKWRSTHDLDPKKFNV